MKHWLLALALGVAAPAAWPLDDKPHVLVQFEIVAPAFRLNLPQRSVAQSNIGNEVALQIAQRYAFADWTVTPRDGETRLGALLLKLEEENAVPNPRIVMRWYAGSDPASATKLPIPAVVLYAATDANWDTNSRPTFETRVTDKLREAMSNDGFYEQLFTHFVQTQPIVKSAKATITDRAIDVPVSWRQMLLGQSSIVELRFTPRDVPDGDPAQLTLTPVIARQVVDASTNSTATLLRGAVNEARIGVTMLPLTQNWNERLPTLLRDAEVSGYLKKYEPGEFAGTAGGLVVDVDVE
jgi:hypothetical protein